MTGWVRNTSNGKVGLRDMVANEALRCHHMLNMTRWKVKHKETKSRFRSISRTLTAAHPRRMWSRSRNPKRTQTMAKAPSRSSSGAQEGDSTVGCSRGRHDCLNSGDSNRNVSHVEYHDNYSCDAFFAFASRRCHRLVFSCILIACCEFFSWSRGPDPANSRRPCSPTPP